MPDCNYCDESFDDEEGYLDHLKAAHDAAELSRIDRRRVGDRNDGEGEFPTGPVVVAGVVLLAAAAVGYVTFFAGSGDTTTPGDGIGAVAEQPRNVGGAHEHGTIDVTIDGRTLDFSRSEFQRPREHAAFHFEGGNGEVWHKHADGVTLEYAMSTLGIEVNGTAVRYDGELYRESDPGTTVTVQVDGEPVDPRTYVLQGTTSTDGARAGDHVRIVVETNASAQ